MWIMISGPYTHGSRDPELWQQNLDLLNRFALEVRGKGHVPIVGVNAVLPMIHVAGMEHYDALMMPICMELAERCDAVLRVGGLSKGADQELEAFVLKGLPVYYHIDEVPYAQ